MKKIFRSKNFTRKELDDSNVFTFNFVKKKIEILIIYKMRTRLSSNKQIPVEYFNILIFFRNIR